VARILVLTNMYPPHHYGGYELSCRDVVERWRAKGHDVSVLTTRLRVPGVPEEPDDGGVRRELEFYWDDHRLLSPPLWRRLAIERANQRRLADTLATTRPDVVSVWNMGAMSLGLLTTLTETGIPLVFVVCDDWPHYGRQLDAWTRLFRRRPRLAAAVRRLTGVPTTVPDLGAAGPFCFVSATVRRWAEERTDWTFGETAVVYSGIAGAEFAPAPGPAATPRSWRWRLLHVGRVDRRKGISTAVEALAQLPPEASLTVLGRGDAGHQVELVRLAAELGLGERVRFDAVARHELATQYRHADVLVFPTAWDEPFGLVPLEAMACGTPVAATGTGGSGEFLAHEVNCLLVPPGEPAALAAAVTRLASDDRLRARLMAGGLTTAASFDVDQLASVLEEWHVGAATGFPSGRPAERSRAG